MVTKLKRYLGLHVHNFLAACGRIVRQPAGTLLTVLVIAIAIALPAGLSLLVKNAGVMSNSWESAADFTAYLDMNASEARGRALASEVQQRDDVAEVTFISRGEALEEFRARSGFGEALQALEENPLPHALVVRPVGASVGEVQALADSLSSLKDISIVQLDTQWVARLQSMLTLLDRVVDIATVLLGLAVILVIGNTIRLEINNRSDEIEVMKLVGGSDGFIRRPFLYLGFWYGLIGASAAALLISIALMLIQAPVTTLAELYASSYTLSGLTFTDTLMLLGGGALLGWAGAWLATTRHLRLIEPS